MNLALKLALLQDGRSAGEIAQEAGLSPNILSRIVRGHRSASQDERSAIAASLGRDASELFPPTVADRVA
jgi:transcriptional regulator with XRE-family HTH domain